VKTLILTAFPRNDGFTRYCTDFFIKGVRLSGAAYKIIDITRGEIKHCKGCFNCWCKTPGKCILKDGMENFLTAFLDTDALVCVTPLYAFGIASYLKTFFERTLPLLIPEIIYDKEGCDRNKRRYPRRGPRHMAGIIVGGLGTPAHSKGARDALRSYAEGMGMHYHGTLVRNESFLLQFTDTKPKTIKIIETAFEQAGRMFALEQKIDPIYIEKVATPLALSKEAFQMYSNIYWEHAKMMTARGGTFDEIKTATRGDLRILMHELAFCVDPVTTSRIKAAIVFKFSDINQAYTITINRGTATSEAREEKRADLTVVCTSRTWVGILHRTLDPFKALTAGEIKLTGDKELFRKFGRYFPPPNY
jgi:multimeric flavodoxin WrbA